MRITTFVPLLHLRLQKVSSWKRVLRQIAPLLVSIQLLVLTSVVLTTSPGIAQSEGETVVQKATEQFESAPLKTSSLGNGVFVFSGDGGNVTAIVDDGSTLLIDSGLDSRTTELSNAIFEATHRPVTGLVNTHWHFDHTGGNASFGSSGLKIIAQENVKRQLSSVHDVPLIGLRDGHYPAQALPTQTYSTNLTLRQGSERLLLANYGAAHTDGDTVIYISPANIAVVGDIFSNPVYPIIDLGSGGSIDGMINSLDKVLAQTGEQTKIVPGHGAVASRADLQSYRDMLVQVRQRVELLITEGKTMDEVVAAAPTKDFDTKWGGGYVTPDVFTKMVFSSLATNSSRQR